MKKRVLSLLLVACMLLTVLPAMALPVVAEETEATGATIKFVNANVNPQVVVDEQTLSGDVMSFTIPALPENGLGWYHMAPDGTIREASTYWGEAAADMTFYLASSKAPFNPSTNWPVFEGSTAVKEVYDFMKSYEAPICDLQIFGASDLLMDSNGLVVDDLTSITKSVKNVLEQENA